MRYPKDKVELTQYTYEPWHYRYVGSKEIATYITENDLILEQYSENIEKTSSNVDLKNSDYEIKSDTNKIK